MQNAISTEVESIYLAVPYSVFLIAYSLISLSALALRLRPVKWYDKAMNPFHASHLLSENYTGECQLVVLVRKHSLSYVDEQNWQMVPAALVEAGGKA